MGEGWKVVVCPPLEQLLWDEGGSLRCGFCDKEFKHPGRLYSHIKIHKKLADKPQIFLCPVEHCRHAVFSLQERTGFFSWGSLKQHFHKSHLPKDLLCSYCSQMRFSIERDRKYHEKFCPERLRLEKEEKMREMACVDEEMPQPILNDSLNASFFSLDTAVEVGRNSVTPHNNNPQPLSSSTPLPRFITLIPIHLSNAPLFVVSKPTTSMSGTVTTNKKEAIVSKTASKYVKIAQKPHNNLPEKPRPRFRPIVAKKPFVTERKLTSPAPKNTVEVETQTVVYEGVVKGSRGNSPNPNPAPPKDAWAQTVEEFLERELERSERTRVAAEVLESLQHNASNMQFVSPHHLPPPQSHTSPLLGMNHPQQPAHHSVPPFTSPQRHPSHDPHTLHHYDPLLEGPSTSMIHNVSGNHSTTGTEPMSNYGYADFFSQTYAPVQQDAAVSADLSTMWIQQNFGSLPDPEGLEDAAAAASDLREAILLSTIETQTDEDPLLRQMSGVAPGQANEDLADFEDILRNMETQTCSHLLTDIETQTISHLNYDDKLCLTTTETQT